MEAYRFENQAKAFDKSMTKGNNKSYILRKGNTRDESSIQLQKQAHVKKESHELEEEDGGLCFKTRYECMHGI